MGKAKIVLAGSDPSFLDNAAHALRGLRVESWSTSVRTVDEAVNACKDINADVLICDLSSNGSDFFAIIDGSNGSDLDSQLIVLSDGFDRDLATKSFDNGVAYYADRSRPPDELFPLLVDKVESLVITRRQKREAEMTEYRLQTLIEVAEKRKAPFHELTHFVLERMVEITGSKIGYIATVDQEEGMMNMFAWSQAGMNQCKTLDKPIFYRLAETGLWGEPVRQGRPIVLNDYGNETELQKGTPKGHVTMNRFMAIPIYHDDKVVATCGVANKEYDYTDRDVRHLSLMMNNLGDMYDLANKDITLHEAEKRYEGILRNIPVAVAVLDAEGVLVDANDLFMNIDGGTLRRNMSLDSDEGIISEMWELFKECRERRAKVTSLVEHSDGQHRNTYWRATVSPVWDNRYRFNGSMLVMDDITNEQESMKILERTAHQLRTVEQITHHDIMNQIQVLRGYIEIMMDAGVPENTVKMLSRMEHSVRTITDQMRFSRTYQTLGVQKPLWLDLDEEVRRAVSGKHGIIMDIDLDAVQVYADISLNKVFFNLFENSTRHGGDVTRVEIVRDHQDDGSLLIIYADDGKGVPEGKKEDIFNKGVGSNTGLGLFLIREILSMTDISIREVGEEGRGVRFEMRFPAGNHRIRP